MNCWKTGAVEMHTIVVTEVTTYEIDEVDDDGLGVDAGEALREVQLFSEGLTAVSEQTIYQVFRIQPPL
jgi:hypothetical protein